jgi:hypothetical protein
VYDESREFMTDEERRRYPNMSPGMLVAMEVQDMMDGTTKPLTTDDVDVAAPVISQAIQSFTAIPAFLSKGPLKWIARRVHPGLINIAAILCGLWLPAFLYLNAHALTDRLISLGLFQLIDNIKSWFQ